LRLLDRHTIDGRDMGLALLDGLYETFVEWRGRVLLDVLPDSRAFFDARPGLFDSPADVYVPSSLAGRLVRGCLGARTYLRRLPACFVRGDLRPGRTFIEARPVFPGLTLSPPCDLTCPHSRSRAARSAGPPEFTGSAWAVNAAKANKRARLEDYKNGFRKSFMTLSRGRHEQSPEASITTRRRSTIRAFIAERA